MKRAVLGKGITVLWRRDLAFWRRMKKAAAREMSSADAVEHLHRGATQETISGGKKREYRHPEFLPSAKNPSGGL